MTNNNKFEKPVNYKLPKRGDIVIFLHNIWNKEPKKRPLLVVEVDKINHSVKVAYGTSNPSHSANPAAFEVKQGDVSFIYTGLVCTTIFEMNKIMDLSYDSSFFVIPDRSKNNTPLIGYLPSCYHEKMEKGLEVAELERAKKIMAEKENKRVERKKLARKAAKEDIMRR